MNPLLRMMMARLQAPAGEDGSDTGGTSGAAEGSIEELAGLVGDDDGAGDGDGGDDGTGGADDDQSLLQRPEDDGQDDGQENDDPNAGADDPEEELELGGQKVKVKKSELIAGYMKDADYRAKTAKVTEQKQHLDAFATHLQQERQQGVNLLGGMIATLQQELVGSQPDVRLIDSDPQEYMRQQVLHGERVQKLQQALGQRQALQQQHAATEAQRAHIRHRESAEHLVSAIPEWRNPTVRAKELEELGNALVARGFSADEVTSTTDHRIVLLARDAAKWQQLQQARAKTNKPPLPRPVRPGASGQSNPNSNTQRAKERLSRNPNDIDALAGLLGASGL